MIRPMRPLGSAVGTLRALRLNLVGARTSNEDIGGLEMIGLQRPPRLQQRVEMHHWHLTQRLDVRISTSILGSVRATTPAPPPAPRAGAPASRPPMVASMLEKRIETVLTRHARSIVETLVASRARVAPTGMAAGTLSVAPTVARGATSVPTAPPVPPVPQMILTRPGRTAGIGPEARPDSAPVAGEPERPARPAPPAPRVPDLQVERIADQVVRALDHRMVAWRERMGRH